MVGSHAISDKPEGTQLFLNNVNEGVRGQFGKQVGRVVGCRYCTEDGKRGSLGQT